MTKAMFPYFVLYAMISSFISAMSSFSRESLTHSFTSSARSNGLTRQFVQASLKYAYASVEVVEECFLIPLVHCTLQIKRLDDKRR